MTLKDEIIQRFFKSQMTLEEVTALMRKKIIKEYEVRNDQFGFDWQLESIREPYCSIVNSCHPIITFHLPKSEHYTNKEIRQWFIDNGFEWTEVNHNEGFRII